MRLVVVRLRFEILQRRNFRPYESIRPSSPGMECVLQTSATGVPQTALEMRG